ncbi:MAG TPA: SMC-Scp complex subunit ScpB [Candidatus Paceibacterota bacterium]|jgi:segregation and condensation protein B|nr:SMC-Scp complex subunit ScpB [Candidatus Paceibacterota bacterium]
MTSDLATRLEAFLFAEGGPVSRKKLLQLLECKPDELAKAVDELSNSLSERGVALIKTDTEVALAIAPAVQGALEKAFEKELGREIGEAGLEVLAIVLYRGASTRAQIDYIRGVNSSTSVRTLLSRGLLERAGNPDDAREYLYRPTPELFAYLGVTNGQELPEYATILAELASFEQAQKASEPFGNDGSATSSED